jgi:hypothetical protein
VCPDGRLYAGSNPEDFCSTVVTHAFRQSQKPYFYSLILSQKQYFVNTIPLIYYLLFIIFYYIKGRALGATLAWGLLQRFTRKFKI